MFFEVHTLEGIKLLINSDHICDIIAQDKGCAILLSSYKNPFLVREPYSFFAHALDVRYQKEEEK